MHLIERSSYLAWSVAVALAVGVSPIAASQGAPPEAAAKPAVPVVQDDAKVRGVGVSTTNTETKAVSDDPNRMICRTSPPLGTRIAKKTCKTAAEWEELRKIGNEAARTGTERGRLIREGEPGG